MHSRCRHKIVMQKKKKKKKKGGRETKTGGVGGGGENIHTFICKHVMHFMADCLTISIKSD